MHEVMSPCMGTCWVGDAGTFAEDSKEEEKRDQRREETWEEIFLSMTRELGAGRELRVRVVLVERKSDNYRNRRTENTESDFEDEEQLDRRSGASPMYHDHGSWDATQREDSTGGRERDFRQRRWHCFAKKNLHRTESQ